MKQTETTEQFQKRLGAHLEKLIVDGLQRMQGIMEAELAAHSQRLTELERKFAKVYDLAFPDQVSKEKP